MNYPAMRRKPNWVWTWMFTALVATSCTVTPTPLSSPAAPMAAPTIAAVTPMAGRPTTDAKALTSPLSTPTTEGAGQPPITPTQLPAPRPTWAPGKGTVSGRVILPPGRERHPSFIVPGELYLGTLVKASDPKLPPAVAVDPLNAPHAIVDQTTGEFVFINVTPGTYALVMIGFSTSYVIEKPDGGGRLDIKVESDRQNAVGDVVLR